MADALVVLNPLNESSPPPHQGELIPVNPAAHLVHWREQFDDVLVHSRSPRTRQAYRSHWRHFSRWCAGHGFEPLPASVAAVIAYVLDCAGECSTSTLTARLAAIAEKHSDAETNPCTHPKLKEVLKGIRRKHGKAVKAKEPTLTDDVRAMVDAQPETLVGIRNRALLLFGYASAMRRSEIVALDVEHLKFTREGLRIFIGESKTDQEKQGQTIAIQYLSGSPYCPVLALRRWLDRAKIKGGPIFRRISRADRVATRTITSKRGRELSPRLTGESVAAIVKQAAESLGKDATIFGAHSLRSGFCTQVAMNGGQVADIMRQTRHKSVDTAMKYVRIGQLFDRNPTTMLGL